MRRLVGVAVFAVFLVGVAGMGSGCAANAGQPAWADPNSVQTSGASTPEVCGRIRSAISNDMKPLGSALGAMIGYEAAGDDSGWARAQERVEKQVKDLSTDIARAAGDASAPKLKGAVTTAVANLDGMASDPTFLSGVSAISDISGISDKLNEATKPISVACG